jgi:hypothetical protein
MWRQKRGVDEMGRTCSSSFLCWYLLSFLGRSFCSVSLSLTSASLCSRSR